MKSLKIILTAALISITSISMTLAGVTENREKLRFGLKAGINYSNVYDERTDDFRADAKIGFAGGLVIHIPIGVYLGIQPEILLSQKGFKGNGSLFGSEYEFTRTTTYLDIPLQLALKPSEFITIVVGPQYSYLLKQKDVFSSTIFSHSHIQEFENDNIRKNIFGIVTGVDINLKQVMLGVRMGWDIQNNHGDGNSNTPRYKNQWLQATIGYYFLNSNN